MQAVISVSGNQYLVTENQQFLVHRLSQTTGKITFSEVLLLVDGDNISVGQPYLKNTSVVAEVLGEEKGDKITVLKFKAKSRYHKTTGFRPKFTRLKVTSIGENSSAPETLAPKKKIRTKTSVK